MAEVRRGQSVDTGWPRSAFRGAVVTTDPAPQHTSRQPLNHSDQPLGRSLIPEAAGLGCLRPGIDAQDAGSAV